MKSRDEAKKMAERTVDTLLERKREYFSLPDMVASVSHCKAWEDGAKAGYMACYDAMTKGEPDGYVTLTPDGSKNSLCLAKGMAIDRLVCPESRCWKTSEEWMGYRDNAWLEYQAQGWQIVPVKLIKVEAK